MEKGKIESRPKNFKTRIDTFLWVFYFARRLRAVKETKSLKTLGFSQEKGAGLDFCRFAHQDDRFVRDAHVAQLVEHVLGKDEVISSILIMGSRQFK